MPDIKKQSEAKSGQAKRPYWRDIRSMWYLVALAVFVLAELYSATARHAGPESLSEGEYKVERVVDGDTLLLVGGARIRLEGIDTPETVKENTPIEAWGPEASEFTKSFVAQAGGRVRLTFPLERLDKYKRFLAFVWNGDELLNEELVRAGLAHAKLGYNFNSAMKRRIAAAQTEAQRNERGIWSPRPTAQDEDGGEAN